MPDSEPTAPASKGWLREWGPTAAIALSVAILARLFLIQAFVIPSGSMQPTLDLGDRVLVNKLSYTAGDIGWGQVVVFNRPEGIEDEEDHLIKRVLALPGDRIEIFGGDVYLNNQRVSETYVLEQGLTEPDRSDPIPNCIDATPTACTIPDGFIFVMGDNREGSTDSRRFGPIEAELVVGRATITMWPLGAIGQL